MTLQPDPDATLVEQARQGDVRAFEMLVMKYQRRIERLIGRFIRDPDSVADVAQETFIRAYRAMGFDLQQLVQQRDLLAHQQAVATEAVGRRQAATGHRPGDQLVFGRVRQP